MAHFTIVAEGPPDAQAARKLCTHTGHSSGAIHITNGKGKLDARLSGYNNAAKFAPWFVMRDLNGDQQCAPALVSALLPERSPTLLLRVAVRSLESWLLADAHNLSKFLGVQEQIIPTDPESLANPKQVLIDLAGRSRIRDIRRDMLPVPGVTARVGRGYIARLIEFINVSWDPEMGSGRSPSLHRCIQALKRLE